MAEEAHQGNVSRALKCEQDALRERDELRREKDTLLDEKFNAVVEIEQLKREAERWKLAVCAKNLTILSRD